MGLHKISDTQLPLSTETDAWHDLLERELGKRVWWQLVNQDYFSMHYTDTYSEPLKSTVGQFLTLLSCTPRPIFHIATAKL